MDFFNLNPFLRKTLMTEPTKPLVYEYTHKNKVTATPMTRGTYNTYRGWTLPENEKAEDEGYLIEHLPGGYPNHPEHTGYISWMVKEAFDASYEKSPSIEQSVPETKDTLKAIDQETQPKPKTASRITPSDIEAIIRSEYYFTATEALVGGTRGPEWQATPSDLDRLTFCLLILSNGYVVTGESACASIENFNAQEGKNIARENAIDKIWPLLGYELRTKLTSQRHGGSQ